MDPTQPIPPDDIASAPEPTLNQVAGSSAEERGVAREDPHSRHRSDTEMLRSIAELDRANAELKRSNEALRRSELELSEFFESAAMGIRWVDADGIVIRANRAELEMLGYASEEYVGHPIAEFHLDPRVNEDIRRRLLAGETIRYYETRMRCKDGVEKTLLLDANGRWEDGRLVHTRGFTRDITAYRQAQRAIERHEETTKLALDAGGMGAWEWDVRSGRVVWSPQLEAIHGLAPGTFGGTFEDFLSDMEVEDRDSVLATIDRSLQSREPYRVEYRIRLPNGTRRWLEARGRVMPTTGPPERMIGVCMDVTDRKIREESEREAGRRKDEFLAILGHELRNPLAPIRNSLEIARLPNVPAEQFDRSWEILDRQVGHLQRLVDDLLDVSRISSGRISLRPEPTDLTLLTRTTLEDHRAAFEGRQVELHSRLDAEPIWVMGDANRLVQAIGNLIQNAIKFTNSGDCVTLTLSGDANHATLVLSDTGVGMTAETLERIFDPFSQADPSFAVNRGGLGLGLTLAREMARLHGGTLEASSAGLGNGSAFTMRLPAIAGRAAAADSRATHSTIPRRVLVVEDNLDAAESMKTLLELTGHRVVLADDAASALARAREFLPEVVICDIGLPGGRDGYDVARDLRAEPSLRGVRLVALTGHGRSADQWRAREAGFDLHLTKPADRSDLERVLSAERETP